MTTTERIDSLRAMPRSERWALAQRRGVAAAAREQRAQKRRDSSPTMREFSRICAESRAQAGLS